MPGDGSDKGKFSPEDLNKIGDWDTVYSVGLCKGVQLDALVDNVSYSGHPSGIGIAYYISFFSNKPTNDPTLGTIQAELIWNGWRWDIRNAKLDWEPGPERTYFGKYGNQFGWQTIWLPSVPSKGEWVRTQQYIYPSFNYGVSNGRDFKEALGYDKDRVDMCPGGIVRWVRFIKNGVEFNGSNIPQTFFEAYGFPRDNKIYLGTAPPPPPPHKKMDCCDCNTIATIIESQMIARDKLFENIKDHIDQRIKEEIAAHGKQLEALEVDLQPVIDRINESENNLWNGIKG